MPFELIQMPSGVIQSFPDFGTEGVCSCYDDDCFDMGQQVRVCCFTGVGYCEDGTNIGPTDGICPFMD